MWQMTSGFETRGDWGAAASETRTLYGTVSGEGNIYDLAHGGREGSRKPPAEKGGGRSGQGCDFTEGNRWETERFQGRIVFYYQALQNSAGCADREAFEDC